MSLAATALLIAGVLALLIYFHSKYFSYWTRSGIPQLKSSNDLDYGVYRKAYWTFKKQGHRFGGIYFNFRRIFLPVDVTLIKHILRQDFQYFQDHGIYHSKYDVLSENLLNIEGEQWKQMRSKLSPTFSSAKMKLMCDIMIAKSEELTKVVRSYVDKNEPINAKEISARYTTDVIVGSAFGLDPNALEDPDSFFLTFNQKVMQMTPLRLFLEFAVPWDLLAFFGYRMAGNQEMEKFFLKLIRDNIKSRERDGIYRKDFIQMLLEKRKAGDDLSDDVIAAQALAFYIGGFETTSSTIAFALLNLSKKQELQDKLREEVVEVFGKYHGKLTYEAIAEMEYMDKVVMETLRLCPPFATTERVSCKAYKIPDTDITLEKGTMVFIPISEIHKDPDYYPNPTEFNPENFSKENKAGRPDCTFLTFGEGPRMCIGWRFAMFNSKAALAGLIKNFKFTISKHMKHPAEVDFSNPAATVKGGLFLDVQAL